MSRNTHTLEPPLATGAVALTGTTAVPRRWARIAIWLVVAAFAVRMAFMLGLETFSYDRIDDVSRINETTYIAQWIAEGKGFSSPFGVQVATGPTAWIPPIHPYLCALVFRALGTMSQPSFLIILAMQSLFSALTVVPILGIAERTVGLRAGVWAAAAWTFFPWFSKWAVTWVYETTFSALLVALLLWYLLWLEENSSLNGWIGFGGLWGLALLANPALITLQAASLGWYAFASRPRSILRYKQVTVALFTCLLVISPWMVRNRVVMGKWIFVRSNFGAEFALGNYPGTLGRGESVGRHPASSVAEFNAYREMGELGYNRWKLNQAVQFIRDNPREFAWVTAKRIAYFWDGSGMRYRPPTAWYWFPWSFAPFSLLTIPAMWVACRNRIHGSQLFIAAIILYPVPYYLVFSLVRYRHVLEPLMLLLIAGLATEFWPRRLPPAEAK